MMGRSKSETFQFWLEYCEMVYLLLDFLTAERESDWNMHLETMINSAVPDVIVELTRCKCTKGCINNVCSCRKANLFCSDACLCNDKDECKNHENLLDATSSDEDD